MIRLQDIKKRYEMGDEVIMALAGVDLLIEENEYVALVGASGSGKSTMMNILGCLDRPSSGEYLLNGQTVSSLSADQLADIRNREIGFIFQNFNLLSRTSAWENVALPLVYRGISPSERKRRAKEALGKVGLGSRLDHHPNQLSGGQRQRVAVARALVGDPSILLADEPTGNLDTATTKELLDLFDQLHREGQTIVMVTHEPDVAAHCERVIRMQDGQVVEDYRQGEG